MVLFSSYFLVCASQRIIKWTESEREHLTRQVQLLVFLMQLDEVKRGWRRCVASFMHDHELLRPWSSDQPCSLRSSFIAGC